ncbi:MAG TPA: PHP domain-containing protein [Victivallales bacterium]|nr:PHP domain-containing protein [Victivallales bacterium]
MIDMHTHSLASDGSFSPSEIVKEAEKIGLYAFALTDHDTISGLEELELASERRGYARAVQGVEISARLGESSIHLCGLFINRSSVELGDLLKRARDGRNMRNIQITEKLNGLGFDISMEDVLGVSDGESVGRPHFAKILIKKGYFKTIQEVFDKLLKRGEPAYVERKLPSPGEAISAIHKSGGISIWAHPFARRNLNRRVFRESLDYIKDLGLDGLEAYYSTYDKGIQEYICQVAKEENLLISGGSDFHGENMDGVMLGSGMGGLLIPDEVFQPLQEAASKIKVIGDGSA